MPTRGWHGHRRQGHTQRLPDEPASPSLPVTVSEAEVLSCPHTHEYSPASVETSSRISSSHTAPSCLRLTLSPALRVSDPFLHSTGAALLSSQHSVTVAPSVASLLLSLPMNSAGKAECNKTDASIRVLGEFWKQDMTRQRKTHRCPQDTGQNLQ